MVTRAKPGRRGQSSRAPKRKTVWLDTFVSVGLSSGGQADLDLLTGLGANDIPGLTLTRTIIDLSFLAQTPGAAAGRMRVDFGIGVTQSEATAANVLPDPQSALDFPTRGWVVRKHKIVTDSIDSFDADALTVEMDLSGRRALHTTDTDLTLIIQNSALLGTTFSVQVQGWVRSLLLMP